MTDLQFVPSPLVASHPCNVPMELVGRARGSAPFAARTFDIVGCPACGLAFTAPVPPPDEAHRLYGDRSSNDFQQGDGGLVARLKAWSARRDARSMRAGDPRRIVDYGCGNGAFVHALSAAYPDATVIGADLHPDPPPGLGPDQYVPAEKLGDRAGWADLVLARHVLEHTYDPLGLLETLGALLAPGGRVVIEVPDRSAVLQSWFGRDWSGWYVPFHTIHFTPAAVSDLAVQAGLTVERLDGVDMPMMGRSIQGRLQSGYGLPLFALGMALHPIQLVAGRITGRPTTVRLTARSGRQSAAGQRAA